MERGQKIDRDLSSRALRRLQTLSEREQKLGQREVCGLIVSKDGVRIRLAYLRNEASRGGEFLISEQSQKSTVRSARGQGMKVLGTFHSHPIGEAIPGPRDIQTARSGSLMLIYDVCGRQARLWKIQKIKGHPKVTELALNAVVR